MVRWGIACLLICFASKAAFAQRIDSSLSRVLFGFEEQQRSDLLDRIFSGSDPDVSAEQTQLYLDDLDHTLNIPFHLRSSDEDLLAIPTITRLDLVRIKDEQMSKRSFVGNSPFHRSGWFELRTRVTEDPGLISTPNYTNHYYHGSPLKISTMLSARTNDIELSLTQSKSPGEPIFFDHLVGALSLRKRVETGIPDIRLEQFCLGDYSLAYGSGLALGKGYPQFPSEGSVSNPVTYSDGIKLYRSTSSYRYFQGAAASLGSEHFTVDLFVSDRNIDAQIDSGAITSLPQTGLHRTATELDRRNAAQQTVTGTSIGYRSSDSTVSALKAGLTAYSMKYDHPIAPADSSSGKFSGSQLTMASVYISAVTDPIEFDAEYAEEHSDEKYNGAFALTVIADPFERLRLTANYHHLPSTFYSPFGGTFSINTSSTQNENGFYAGFLLDVFAKLSVFGYAATSTALTQTTNSTEFRFGAIWSSRLTTADVQWRTVTTSSSLFPRNEYLIDLVHHLSSSFEVSVKGQYRIQRDSSSSASGESLSLGTRYKPMTGVQIGLLVEPYHSDSFASRLFSVEPDLPGNLSLVQLYGSGIRYQLVCTYAPLTSVSLSGSFAETVYTYLAGAVQTQKTTLGIQCDVRF